MKYKTIGAFKSVQNVPDCVADVDLKVGMGVILDRFERKVKLPSGDPDCKACHRIVTNIDIKPDATPDERRTVLKGEYVRADDLTTVANLEIEFAADELTTELTTVNAKDKLVFDTTGKLKVETSVDDYKVYFEVIEKTGYMGGGVLAVIRVNDPKGAAE